ncbi:MAG: alpha/beta fold hydrolase, partial [Candidatus Margulisiibacteriota bacterium]
MGIFSIGNARPRDNYRLSPPHFLTAKDLFARDKDVEVFIKKVYSTAKGIPRRGAVILAPGTACNGNVFRLTADGRVLTFNHTDSFANLLASEGFDVYLHHPGYSERVMNRYVARHCPQSIHYGKPYNAPSDLTFDTMVNWEVPMLVDAVCEDSKSENISWVGFSLGGMLAYAYLSRYKDGRIRNLATIGSPVSLTQTITQLIAKANKFSKALGKEEKSFLAEISENFVPLGSLVSHLPGRLIKSMPLVKFLFNPDNMHPRAIKSFFGKIVEPIPSGLENSFSHIISNGFSNMWGDFDYLEGMKRLRNGKINFLFFYGQDDQLATADSVRLAHEVLTPNDHHN